MKDAEVVQRAKDQLALRLELLGMVYPRLKEIAESGGKNGVKRYFVKRFGKEPIEDGDELFFNDWILQFDSRERLLQLSFRSGVTRELKDR